MKALKECQSSAFFIEYDFLSMAEMTIFICLLQL